MLKSKFFILSKVCEIFRIPALHEFNLFLELPIKIQSGQNISEVKVNAKAKDSNPKGVLSQLNSRFLALSQMPRLLHCNHCAKHACETHCDKVN